jgi:hypothetical protein
MSTIHFTDSGAAARIQPATRTLASAASAASRAPSLFDTQPWRWRIHHGSADLYADRSRQLTFIDPDGSLLMMSCGAALHHARTALSAAGFRSVVQRFGGPGGSGAGPAGSAPAEVDPDLVARLRVSGPGSPDPEAMRLRHAMSVRRIDRRPFRPGPVPAAVLGRLSTAAEVQGAHLHVLRSDHVTLLTVGAVRTAQAQLNDPGYRSELARWIPPGSDLDRLLPPAAAGAAEHETRYAILFATSNTRPDWVAAGEALSAVLLTAAVEGLGVAAMSDVIAVPAARALLCRLLSGIGHPMLALRIGLLGPHATAPSATDPMDPASGEMTDGVGSVVPTGFRGETAADLGSRWSP